MDNSHFGKLPPELRNHVYELALCHGGTIDILAHSPKAKVYKFLHKNVGDNILALSKTCRQVRAECLSVFYSSNKFTFTLMGTLAREPKAIAKGPVAFMNRIGPASAQHLRELVIKHDTIYNVWQSLNGGTRCSGTDTLQVISDMLKLTKRLRNRNMKCKPVLELCTGFPVPPARQTELKVRVDFHNREDSLNQAVEILSGDGYMSPAWSNRLAVLEVDLAEVKHQEHWKKAARKAEKREEAGLNVWQKRVKGG